jgi:putative spermidine/putrescine transport system permease protein
MFSGIRDNISPAIAAAATVLVVVATLLLLVLEWQRRRTERLRGAAGTIARPVRRAFWRRRLFEG